jgi:nucleotide-binding universal stress UspA family protein
MKRFQHIVVNLSLKDTDASVLSWTSNLVRLANSGKVTVLHAWQPVDIPAELKERYPWLLEPGEDVAGQRMDELIAQHLQVDPTVQVERVVFRGSPLGEVLRVAESGDADLVVCGRSAADIFLSEKLARKAPCSVLTVPSFAGSDFDRVMVPVDYSEYSRQALDIALAFAAAEHAKLTVFHAFEVPWGQSRSTMARPDFVADLRIFHERRLREFVEEVGPRGVQIDFKIKESLLTSTAIASAVEEGGHDLVIIGCRGHHAIYATLLGSTAESILHGCPVPVVAVKAKGSQRGLLAALRGN